MMRRKQSNQLDLIACADRMPTALSRATASRSKLIEAPAPKPWLCAVLAIDTARRSGWSIATCGTVRESGEVDTLDEATIDQIVRSALDHAGHPANLPLVLVLESAHGGSVNVQAGLGMARERWLRAWRMNEQSPTRVVRVQANTWRAAVLGSYWARQSREVVRPHEVLTAESIVKHPCGPDEAPAILIARWASHAARIGRAIGKRASKASLRAWTGKAKRP